MPIDVRKKGDAVTLEVRLSPRSSRDQITGEIDGKLQIKVKAPPVEGAANQALIAFLSNILKVPKSRISVISGHSSRNKVVAISGMEPDEVVAAVEKHIG